jgi:diketogulonate reductase-like aldo/keto reductase
MQLGLSYVNLYLIHNPVSATPSVTEVWKELELLKKEGKAKYVSSFPACLQAAEHRRHNPP